MNMLEVARVIAVAAHSGQVDKAGESYYLHVERVELAVADDRTLRTVALLHDVVEDSDVHLDDIEFAGFPSQIVDAVNAITRRVDEAYRVYIERVARNPLAVKVKLADLSDNMDPRRQTKMDSLLRRYRDAEAVLLAQSTSGAA